MIVRYVLISLWLGAAAGAASALTVGAARGGVVLGRPVDVAVEVTPDPGKALADSCIAAEVLTGDRPLSRVRVLGQDGAVIHTGYSADLEAGTVSIVDVTGWSQPATIQHRIEDPLCEGLLSGQFKAGAVVQIGRSDKDIVLSAKAESDQGSPEATEKQNPLPVAEAAKRPAST